MLTDEQTSHDMFSADTRRGDVGLVELQGGLRGIELSGLIGPLHIRLGKCMEQLAVRGVGKDLDPRNFGSNLV